MAFVVIARFSAKAGLEGRLREVLSALVAPTRAEAGCLHYEMVQSQDDARKFTFYEKWEDEAALMAHAQTPHVVRARAERVDLLDGPHDVSRWDICNVNGKS
jgi:quinol monooxygenase YgiN